MRIAAALLALVVLAFSPTLASAKSKVPPIYGVVFEIKTDAAGKIESLRVARVTIPSSGSTKGVDVPVPEAYVAAYRASIETREHPAGQTFFMVSFYDPLRPDSLNVFPVPGR